MEIRKIYCKGILMKESPNPKNFLNPKSDKIKYQVTIEDSVFITSAYTEESAISNAAFRYADENDESVGLVRWKIKQGDLFMEVEEVE